MKNMDRTQKLCLAAVLCAVAVAGSLLSFPIAGSKCAPVQHMVNILCAVFLGPGYGVGAAFGASLIRNLLGLGSPMAFPGSMCGALLCVAILALGQSAGEIAFYAYIIPFFISTAAGAALSGVILGALSRSGALKRQGEEV